MVDVSFYGGVGEIGGNKILIEGNDGSFFLDFGKSYSQEASYFGFPQPQPRDKEDLLALGLLPNLDGLYEDAGIDGVLLSHGHGDHWDYARYLSDEIPLYCGETTKEVILARERASSSTPPLAKLTSTTSEVYKEFHGFRTGDKVSLGSMAAEPVHVDHSVPGSYGLILETSAGNVAYSGDLRLHGNRPDLTEDFVEKSASADPELFIVEGTNIAEGEVSSEPEVADKLRKVVSRASALVMVTCPVYDVDRLRSLHAAAKAAGRKLALSLKQAYVLHSLREDPHLDLFSPRDPDVAVYRSGKKTWYQYEKAVREAYPAKMVEASDVNDAESEYVLLLWLHRMTELIDIQPSPGSVFISSQSEPFNEEMEVDYERLLSWLRHYGVPHYRIHCSGHAMPQDLKEMIRKVDPRRVAVIHTDEPELYERYISDLDIPVVKPELGQTLRL